MNVTDLAAGIRAGRPAAVARGISLVERGRPEAENLLQALFAESGRAHIVGVTGIPGSGKSTLVTRLTEELRRRGRTVGIVAIDPSSPYSGGSILGDRVRMGSLGGDPGVFIRSMATRGALGGIARATVDAVSILDAAGKDVVLIETVGVGQDEVEIVTASHTTAVVSVPGTGDDIQAIKAGVLEIADIHVVNKADRDGADRLVAQLKEMLRLAGLREGDNQWHVPVEATAAEDGTGIATLCDRLESHRNWLEQSHRLAERERAMAEARLRSIVQQLVRQRLLDRTANSGFDAMVDQVAARRRMPLDAARALLAELGHEEPRPGANREESQPEQGRTS